ncbi:hypothetical protein TNCV_2940161 [Trichonephila clavipes]|nr:hypothetical protein TNCV_2940161 [Trichonephila clavipes]
MVFGDRIRLKVRKRDGLYSTNSTSVLIPREEEKARHGGGFKWIPLEKHMIKKNPAGFNSVMVFGDRIRLKVRKRDCLYSTNSTSVLIPREEEKARHGGGFKWIPLEKHMVSIAALKRVLAN